MPNTILLKGDGVRVEAQAAGAITPGMLVMLDTNGKFAANTVADAVVPRSFALENEIIGKGITDAYAADDIVQAIYAYPGAEVYALVPASASAITIGKPLKPNNAGYLVLATGTAPAEWDDAVAIALEAVNNSAGGTPARIKVRVI